MGLDLDKWIDKVKKSEYLAEEELKALCEHVRRSRTMKEVSSAFTPGGYTAWQFSSSVSFLSRRAFNCALQIKEILVEESNVQPVNSPVTVRFPTYLRQSCV